MSSWNFSLFVTFYHAYFFIFALCVHYTAEAMRASRMSMCNTKPVRSIQYHGQVYYQHRHRFVRRQLRRKSNCSLTRTVDGRVMRTTVSLARANQLPLPTPSNASGDSCKQHYCIYPDFPPLFFTENG